MRAWEQDFFDLEYAALALSEAPEAAELDALMARLGLKAGDRVLDQGCGIGRITRALAARGVQATGLDLVPAYVAQAEALTGELPARFVCADAGRYRPPALLDAVINWNSSFGYRPGRAALLSPLVAAFEALRPGGRLGLETSHDLALLRVFQPRFVQRHGEVEVLRESRVDLSTGMLHQTWRFPAPGGGERVREGHRRLLSPDQLVDLLLEVGFVKVSLMADLEGAPLELDSPRVLLFAERPA
ncbi:MAG: methyltransferase domain-containing protein [Alphaproteobacteria bacterium]|nr:methyltransferase domain-containing protein [Alphaproteobacteria bacterium]MCB9794673.1 methyltransferase domain-containing protein [Alphaproteobacteria bacterium]